MGCRNLPVTVRFHWNFRDDDDDDVSSYLYYYYYYGTTFIKAVK